MSLPRVLPGWDGLDVEDDPEVLRDRALWLRRQWQRLEKKDPAAVKNYPKTVVKAAAVQLLHQYASLAVTPVSYELVQLFEAIVSPDRKSTSLPVRGDHLEAVWTAIRFEAAEPKRSVYAVAQHLREEGKRIYEKKDELRKNGRQLTEPEAYLASLAWQSQKSIESTVRAWRKLSYYQDNVQLYRTKIPSGEAPR